MQEKLTFKPVSYVLLAILRILAMHEAKSVNTQSIKNLRRTFFNPGMMNNKVRLRFLVSGLLAEI